MDPSPRRTRSSSKQYALDIRTIAPIPIMKVEPRPPESPLSVSKRARHKMTDYQLQRLEELYQADSHPNRGTKEALAREIGMSAKSVLIWFQNRRQERSRKSRPAATPPLNMQGKARISDTRSTKPRSKKAKSSKSNDNPAALSLLRPISLLVPNDTTSATLQRVQHEAPSLERIYGCDILSEPSLVTPGPSRNLSSSSNTLHSASQSPDLWKNLPPTPPSSHIKPPLTPFGNAFNLIPYSDRAAATRPQKPSLEWACANSAARRKHELFVYRDEDDSTEESGEFDPERSDRTLAGAGDHGLRAIPREFHALFSPDVLIGASLLLTLKHSTNCD